MSSRPVITLTTDFGLADHFVGVMKGVILSINPEVELVDLCHEVSSFDLLDGAFTLGVSYRYFPAGSIHLAVVDPGVGSARRPILVSTRSGKFVAPDNGVLSLVCEREEPVEVRHITADHRFLKPVSRTFHGRDVFAPVAGWLSKGVGPEKFGEPIDDWVRLPWPRPERVSEELLKATVIKVDRFGNIITNLAPPDLPGISSPAPAAFRITVSQREITRLSDDYSSGKPGDLFAIWGSSGFLEIATNRGSAASMLGAARGSEVEVRLS